MYYIAICDDDEYFINNTKQLLLALGLNQEEVTFFEYCSGEALVDDLPKIAKIDLLILDIFLPAMSGEETAQIFRQHFPASLLVFCSGVSLPTTESFKTTPFRFLIKKYTDDTLIEEFKVIIDQMKKNKSEPYLFAHWHNNYIRLSLYEIAYISISRRKTQILVIPGSKHYEFESHIFCEESLSDLYEMLKDYHFEYAHSSYLVNLRYIKRKTATELELMDGTLLGVARSKERQLRHAWAKYMSQKYQ